MHVASDLIGLTEMMLEFPTSTTSPIECWKFSRVDWSLRRGYAKVC